MDQIPDTLHRKLEAPQPRRQIRANLKTVSVFDRSGLSLPGGVRIHLPVQFIDEPARQHLARNDLGFRRKLHLDVGQRVDKLPATLRKDPADRRGIDRIRHRPQVEISDTDRVGKATQGLKPAADFFGRLRNVA